MEGGGWEEGSREERGCRGREEGEGKTAEEGGGG